MTRLESINPRLRRNVLYVVGHRVIVHRADNRWSWCPYRRSTTACASSSFCRHARQKSSRACAPRLSVRLAAESIVTTRLRDQVVEFERLDQIGIPGQRTIGHGDVADRRHAPCESGSGLHATRRRCGTPRSCSASRVACCRAVARSACRPKHDGNDRAGSAPDWRSPPAIRVACRSA